MMYIQSGLYVVIEQLETPLAPTPRPLLHGFSKEIAYLVLGAFSLSESGEAYFVLSNDENQIWFISNRHLRTHELLPGSTEFRLPLESQIASHANSFQGDHGETSKPFENPAHACSAGGDCLAPERAITMMTSFP